ncbi:2-hydroxychromene-2-carboxylate isomerase [Sphingomonadaceae bacterium OTU29LAMAA1]|nr:2-hydroxychromene-2-carboxylate isomerase [Sphingomonadaceae bacterium OTU29LAMAA1]
MTRTVELYFDFRSPYGYLAFVQLQTLAVELQLKPIKVLALMERVGNTPTTTTCKAKGRHARTDLGRWSRRVGVALNPAGMGSVDGEGCARAVLAARDEAQAVAIASALYRAIWTGGRSLPGTADIIQAIADAGIDADGVSARIDIPETAARLDAFTQEAADRGVFGSPTMFVGNEMFFGNDRIDFLRDELERVDKAA